MTIALTDHRAPPPPSAAALAEALQRCADAASDWPMHPRREGGMGVELEAPGADYEDATLTLGAAPRAFELRVLLARVARPTPLAQAALRAVLRRVAAVVRGVRPFAVATFDGDDAVAVGFTLQFPTQGAALNAALGAASVAVRICGGPDVLALLDPQVARTCLGAAGGEPDGSDGSLELVVESPLT